MALSQYEELVMAELERQFHQHDAPRIPRLSFHRLAGPLACLLTGAGLLVAAHQPGLAIRISDFWGFSTSSIASTLGFAGHAMLLAGAFLLGHVFYGLRQEHAGQAAAETSVSPKVPSQRV